MNEINDIIKSVASCLKASVANMDKLDSEEFKNTCDGIKDLAEANYHCAITEAMEKPENQYGVNYDEKGKFYTPLRNASTGRYMSRGYNEIYSPEMKRGMQGYRDMDYSDGKMYYTDSSNMSGSRYEMARRGYEEAKEMDPHSENVHAMKKIFETLTEDMEALKDKMTANEKATARNQFTSLANMMM